MSANSNTDAAHVAALTIAANAPTFYAECDGNYAVVPEGYRLESLEQFQHAPNRTRAKVAFTEPKSLAAYLDRFTVPSGVWGADAFLTVNYDTGNISAVIGYSGATDKTFHDHVATYQAAVSTKFAAWRAMCNKPLRQIALAHFLEGRAVDVMKPDAADIMEMVLKFEATKTVEFKSATRLQDGSRQITFVEDATQRGAMTLPDHIIILVPIYKGMEPQPVKLWLRFRIEDAKLALILEVHDEEETMRAAFERCVDAFLHGAPDGQVPVLHVVG